MKSGIDRAHFDTAVRPQDDLFRHVNGAWLETAEIPADRPFDGAFYHLREKAEADLRVLIEEAPPARPTGRRRRRRRSATSTRASSTSSGRRPGARAGAADLARATRRQTGLIRCLLGRAGAHGRRRAVRHVRRHRRQAVRPLHRQPRPGRPRPAGRVVLPRGALRGGPRVLRRPPHGDARAGRRRRRPRAAPTTSWPWRPGSPRRTGTASRAVTSH